MVVMPAMVPFFDYNPHRVAYRPFVGVVFVFMVVMMVSVPMFFFGHNLYRSTGVNRLEYIVAYY
jgi:hypothetical protein